MTKYDAIIIGSGQAGNPLARKLAAVGWKVALIEKKWVGGTCINTGCTPTKTLVASGRIAWLMRRSAEYGIHTADVSVNIEEVIRRKNALVLAYRESIMQSLIKARNITLVFGNAHFSGVKEVTVVKEDGSQEEMTADKIFINTGAHALIPDIPGLNDIPYYTSGSLIDLVEIPRHLIIIGGSYVALELGQLYRRLGSEVTLIERGTTFLQKEDDDVATELKKILTEDGLTILINSQVKQVAAKDKDVLVDWESSGEGPSVRKGTIVGSHLLVATGRAADTSALNAAAAGIQVDPHGFVTVNAKLETNVPGIYALGDVKGGPQFTHYSYNDYLIVYKNLIENGNESITDRISVYCMFTDPELGRVGLTEKEAIEKGFNIKVARMSADRIARASENSETRGILKAIVNADNKKIIGAAILTAGGGELMSILQMAMMGGIPYDKIRDAVFAHPTFAESLNNLFAGFDH